MHPPTHPPTPGAPAALAPALAPAAHSLVLWWVPHHPSSASIDASMLRGIDVGVGAG